MLISSGYDIALSVSQPTTMVAMLSIRPERFADLLSPHRIETNRNMDMETYEDVFGNICTRFRLDPGVTTLSCSFLIADHGRPDIQCPDAQETPVIDLPGDVMPFLMGSRYCETDRLSASAWSLFGHLQGGWHRVQAIVDFTHRHLTYGYQYADPTRTAFDAFNERVGVCRDFAHLAVALCRCMNIPARYCSGYLGDIGIDKLDVAMDFHAWFEVYLGGSWYAFDARHRVPRIGRILMACGRDAADTALTTAFGQADLVSFAVHTDELSDCPSRSKTYPAMAIAA